GGGAPAGPRAVLAAGAATLRGRRRADLLGQGPPPRSTALLAGAPMGGLNRAGRAAAGAVGLPGGGGRAGAPHPLGRGPGGGEWSPPALTPEVRSGLGLLLLDGLVVRRVGVAGRVGSELLGEGDVLRPWEGEGGELMRAQKGRWGALRRGRLAVLDRDFSQRV